MVLGSSLWHESRKRWVEKYERGPLNKAELSIYNVRGAGRLPYGKLVLKLKT